MEDIAMLKGLLLVVEQKVEKLIMQNATVRPGEPPAMMNANQQYAQPPGGIMPQPTPPFGASAASGSANFPQQQQQYAVPPGVFFGQAPAGAYVQAPVGKQPPPPQYGYQPQQNVGSNDLMDYF